MAKKLFNKNITPYCMYCEFAHPCENEDSVVCKNHGVVSKFDSCRKYRYDPLKRIPSRQTIGNDYSSQDFEL